MAELLKKKRKKRINFANHPEIENFAAVFKLAKAGFGFNNSTFWNFFPDLRFGPIVQGIEWKFPKL
jgi:hypothetical protein